MAGTLDISQLLKSYANKYEKYFKDQVRKKQGIDGASYSALKNKRQKGHNQGLNTRLNDSGRFQQNAVVASSTDTTITIEGNTAVHSKGVTYNDIIAYNNRDNSNVNRNIDNPPSIFPTKEEDVEKMEITKEFYNELDKVIRLQLDDLVADALKAIPRNIKVG